MSDFVITRATINDVPAIQKLLHETWQATYSHYLSEATIEEVYQRWQNLDFLTQQIQNPDMYFPVAKEAATLVGVATARMEGNTLVIFRLYVYCLQQGKGIGSGLLQHLVGHFPQAEKIQLHVEAANEKAHLFYLRHGFQDIKRVSEQVGKEQVEEILMEKILNT